MFKKMWYKIIGRCFHDWEVVEYGKLWKKQYRYIDPFYENVSDDHEKQLEMIEMGYTQSKKKVCIKCNKCIDEEKFWEEDRERIRKKYKEEEKIKRKRKELALKMWADGCYGK